MAQIITAGARIRGLRRLQRQIDGYGLDIFPRAAASALNRTASAVRTQSVRDIAKRLGLKQKPVRDRITIRRASPRNLEARVKGSAKPIPLKEFGARQTREGVTAKTFGRRTLFRHAFIARSLGNNVFIRKLAARLPIKLMFGPNITLGLDDPQVATTRERLVDATLRKRLKAELEFRIGKLRST